MNLPGLSFDPDHPDLAWRETRAEGVAWIPLWLPPREEEQAGTAGERRGDATVLIRMQPGRGYPAHRHLGPEEVLILAGGYRDHLGEHRAGDHVRYPQGSRHAPVALGDPGRPAGPENPACVLFAVAQGGVELLEPRGGAS